MKKSIALYLVLFIFCSSTKGITLLVDRDFQDSINIVNKNTLSDKVFGLSRLWSEIKYNFVNIDQINFNLDSLYEAIIPQVLQTTNDIDYYDELQKFLSHFNDGHTGLIQRSYYWNEVNDYIPCNLVDIDQKIYFSKIRKNSGIDSSLVGAEIIEIEGKPTIKFIEEDVYPYISASTEPHRWFQAISRIQGGIKGSYFRGKVKKEDGIITDFSILRNGEATRAPNGEQDEQWVWFKKNDEEKPVRRVSLDWNDDIAILDIRSFSSDKIMDDIDSVAVLINNKSKGLIIDLRYNGGGSSNVALHLLKYLTNQDSILTFGAQTRINNAYGRSQGNYQEKYSEFYWGNAYKTYQPEKIKKDNNIQTFNCPVVILIGRFTFSAAEDFLVNLYEIPERPILIGESTGGSTGAPLIVNLPHGAIARICTIRVLFPYSKEPFIGKGIQPDITVTDSKDDYIMQNDAVMQKAISLFRE